MSKFLAAFFAAMLCVWTHAAPTRPLKGAIDVQKTTIKDVKTLRRDAKKISQVDGIPYSHALDRLAQNKGFKNWSMLQKNGVFDPANPRLSDLDLDNSEMVRMNVAQQSDKAVFLLRFLEGAPVALYRHCNDNTAEIVPTRRDLYEYVGGFAWGYHGSGPTNLSFALAGKILENQSLSSSEISNRARALLDKVISRLDEAKEYELRAEDLRHCMA